MGMPGATELIILIVAMILISGIVIIIRYFIQAKGEKVESVYSADNEYNNAMLEAFVAKPEKLEWYKKSFAKYNVNGMSVMKWNWSWWAFFGGWAFLMYRKQYLAAFVLFIIELISQLMYLGIITMILSGGFATYFVYKGYRTKITEIESSVDDNIKRIDTMKHIGGYNGWAIFAKIIGVVLQIFVAMVIYASIFGMNMDEFSNYDSDEQIEARELMDKLLEEIGNNSLQNNYGFRNGESYSCENSGELTIANDGGHIYINGHYVPRLNGSIYQTKNNQFQLEKEKMLVHKLNKNFDITKTWSCSNEYSEPNAVKEPMGFKGTGDYACGGNQTENNFSFYLLIRDNYKKITVDYMTESEDFIFINKNNTLYESIYNKGNFLQIDNNKMTVIKNNIKTKCSQI